MADKFLGAWLVSEYVYEPDGRFAGIVRQRRELAQLDHARIRVSQWCQPEPDLAGHVLAAFAGKWVFELSIDGRFRRYHGPDLIGSGTSWGDGAMTGQGLWPRFGYNFRSFALLPHPQRQLTGGRFSLATTVVANIAGLAVPESNTGDYPEFAGTTSAAEISPLWQGTCRTISATGAVLHEGEYWRRYSQGQRWRDLYTDEREVLFDRAGSTRNSQAQLLVSGEKQAMIGVDHQFGWMWEAEAVSESGRSLQVRELLDGNGGYLVGMRHWLQDGLLQHIDVIQLRPAPVDDQVGFTFTKKGDE